MLHRSIRAALTALLLLGTTTAISTGATAEAAEATEAAVAAAAAGPPGSAAWSSVHSGLDGVAARGRVARTGDRVRVTGSLLDTADDGRAVRLDVRPFGGCCFQLVKNERGGGTRARFDVTLTGAAHVAIREVTYDDQRMRVGRWVRLL